MSLDSLPQFAQTSISMSLILDGVAVRAMRRSEEEYQLRGSPASQSCRSPSPITVANCSRAESPCPWVQGTAVRVRCLRGPRSKTQGRADGRMGDATREDGYCDVAARRVTSRTEDIFPRRLRRDDDGGCAYWGRGGRPKDSSYVGRILWWRPHGGNAPNIIFSAPHAHPYYEARR